MTWCALRASHAWWHLLHSSCLLAVATLCRMVEDADLWRWSLPDSQAFHAGLAGLKLEYSALANPDIFDQLLALNPQQVIAGVRLHTLH